MQSETLGNVERAISPLRFLKDTDRQASSPFFNLPPELRNIIYSLSFTHDRDHTIVTRTYKPPALLSTSRQIRAEAAQLWSTAKPFEVELHDCDITLYKAFFQRVLGSIQGDGTLSWDIVLRINGVNWKNLLHWCQEVHKGVLDPVSITANPHRSWAVIQAALNLADFAKAMPWEDLKSHWENLRMVALLPDSRWV